MTTKKNRFQEAFKEQFNVLGLAGAAALSAALLNPLPLLIGFAVEAAYLLFVPDSKWYESRLSRRFDAEVIARREALKAQVFPLVPEQMQRRFTRLEQIRAEIDTQPGTNDQWFREVVRQLDYLLEKFLLFARKDTEFRDYLESVLNEDDLPDVRVVDRRSSGRRRGGGDRDRDAAPPPQVDESRARRTVQIIQARYDGEIERINAEIEREEDLNTKAVLQKRVSVLEQRRDYVGKIGKILTNLAHQMGLLEDSFGLINDQLRARSPEQVLADIEGVVYQTDSMTKLLEELAPYDQASARMAA
jgi:hypothetical protein